MTTHRPEINESVIVSSNSSFINDQMSQPLKERKRQCKHPACSRLVKSQGLCQRHGAKPRRCKAEGCCKQAQGNFGGMCSKYCYVVENNFAFQSLSRPVFQNVTSNKTTIQLPQYQTNL